MKKKVNSNTMLSKLSDIALEDWRDDKLGFQDYAEGVISKIEEIDADKGDTPFSIGIFGSWGSGKTSFMKIMEKILESKSYKTIFFNSWEYGNEEKPWIPFMIKVVDKLFEEEKDKKELIKNIFLFSTDFVLKYYSQGNISTENVREQLKKSKKTSPFIDWSDGDVKTVIERIRKIDNFKEAITGRTKGLPNKKIIIFIDDLDRIPEKLIDFLNSLKTFLDIKGCIFILGCDYKILESALKDKYQGEEIYENYFDKIVQAEFYIPRISEQAITEYLQFLTGSEKDVEDYTRLVIHSIGGNPRKIKRVVNATKLIKSVFERKVGTILQAFERHKPDIRIEHEEKEKDRTDVNAALKSKIQGIFTPAKVFYSLFDDKVLFKLMCMREQWPRLYERILSEEMIQEALISSQNADITKLLEATEVKGEKLKKTETNLPVFLEDSPKFHGIEDIKTYLTLFEISSPVAGISLNYGEPEKLPIKLFNRYIMFEHINRGKVEKEVIENKIKEMDWESDWSSYNFFIEVLSAFGYDDLIKNLFEEEKNLENFADKIKEADLVEKIVQIIRLRVINEEAFMTLRDTHEHENYILFTEQIAKDPLNKIKDIFAEKIIASVDLASVDPLALSAMLNSVNTIDEKIAKELLNKIKDVIGKKIKASTDPLALNAMLNSVRAIDEKIAKELFRIIYCASDLHIGYENSNYQKIKQFFNIVRENADELILCGDVFDLWRDSYDKILNTVKPDFETVMSHLKQTAAEVPTTIIPGNHDYNLMKIWKNYGDYNVSIADPFEKEGIYFCHGWKFDVMQRFQNFSYGLLVLKSSSFYQRFLKSSSFYQMFLKSPSFYQRFFKKPSQMLSRNDEVNANIIAIHNEANHFALKNQLKYVVMGHTHIPVIQDHIIDCGDFIDSTSYVILINGVPQLKFI